MNPAQLYKQKLRTKEDAVTYIQPETDIITPILAAEPGLLMKQLVLHDGLKGNRLFQMLSSHERSERASCRERV